MMNKVFIDTGGWLAFMNKKDRYNKLAEEYFIKLRKENIPLITSNYIISETLTWLNYIIVMILPLKP
jgi:predicted nucleic acid-binding protein